MGQGQGPGERRRGVVGGAVALAAAGLLAKGLSAVYRVLVAQWLGAEAVGLYELAAPVLATGISLCGMGLPVATSALVATALGRGQRGAARDLLRATRLLLTLTGALGATLVLAFAPRLAGALGNPAAAGAIRAVAPAILLATLLAGEKAWLQGSGRVAASAGAVSAEQVARVGAALVAARAFIGRGAAAGAAAVAWAPAVGAAGGLLACGAAEHLARPREGSADGRAGTADLLRAGFPNWAAGVVSALTTALDAAFVVWRLRAAGLGDYTATAWLGELSGMAMPVAAGPAVLFGALGSALVPDLALDWARGRRAALRRRGAAAYFWSLAIAIPCAAILWQLSEPICRLIFPRNVGAAQPLSVLAFTGIPLAAGYVAAAAANAVGRPAVLLPGAVSGAAAKSALVLALTGTAGLGVRGAALGILAGQLLGTALNVRAVGRETGCRPPFAALAVIALPAVAGQTLAAHAVWVLTPAAALPLRLLAAGLAAAAAYLLIFGVLSLLWGRRLDLPVWPRWRG